MEEITRHKYSWSPLPAAASGEERYDIFIPNRRKLVAATVRMNGGRWDPVAGISQQPALGIVGPQTVQYKVRWSWSNVPPRRVSLDPTDRETFIDYDLVVYVEPTSPIMSGELVKGHLIAFEHASFRGRHRHIINGESNLGNPDDASMDMTISSIVVVSGTWAFYQNANFGSAFGNEFGPGAYAMVSDYGIANDAIRSLKCVG